MNDDNKTVLDDLEEPIIDSEDQPLIPGKKELPEGFNPEEYGLIPKSDYERTEQELQAERKRREDAQRALHEKTGEIAGLRQRPYEQSSQTPQYTAQQAWNYYQQSGDAKWYNAYVEADIAERNSLREETRKAREDATMAAQMAAAAPVVRDLGFAPEELNKQFDPNTGGKWFDWDEAALVALSRKSGGVKAFMDSLRREGVGQLRRDTRVPSSAIPSAANRRGDTAPQEPDFNRMSDEQFMAWEKANQAT